MGKIKAVIFDLDGTLIDSHPDHMKAFKKVLGMHKIRASERQIRCKFGMGSFNIIRGILRENGLDSFSDSDVRAMENEKNREYRKLARPVMMPGAAELVSEIRRRGLRLAVATSTSREDLELAKERSPVGKMFGTFVDRSEVAEAKPDPMIYLRAAEKLGVEPGECIAIDDAVVGVRSARAAGMVCVGVATGEWPLSVLKKEGCAAFLDLNDVLANIDSILEGKA